MNRFIALIPALLLAACANQPVTTTAPAPVAPSASTATTAPAVPTTDPLTQLKDKLAANAVGDLQNAIAIANEPPVDKAGLQCYTWELSVAQSLQGQTNPPPPPFAIKTPITNFEKIRKARLSLGSGSSLMSDFNLNCAALFNDEIATLAKIGIQVGGITGTGGLAAPALGVIGVINRSLPIPIGQ